jgi:hypothetical protein
MPVNGLLVINSSYWTVFMLFQVVATLWWEVLSGLEMRYLSDDFRCATVPTAAAIALEYCLRFKERLLL